MIDVLAAITGQHHNGNSNAAVAFTRLKRDYPEVTANCSDFKFAGRGQRNTPVTGVRGIVEIIMLLGGSHAARVRDTSRPLSRCVKFQKLVQAKCLNQAVRDHIRGPGPKMLILF